MEYDEYNIDLDAGTKEKRKHPQNTAKYDDLDSFFKSKKKDKNAKMISATKTQAESTASGFAFNMKPPGRPVPETWDSSAPRYPIASRAVPVDENTPEADNISASNQVTNRGQKTSKKKKMIPVNVDLNYANPPDPRCSSKVDYVGMEPSSPVESAKMDYWLSPTLELVNESAPDDVVNPPPGYASHIQVETTQNGHRPPLKVSSPSPAQTDWEIAGGAKAQTGLKKKLKARRCASEPIANPIQILKPGVSNENSQSSEDEPIKHVVDNPSKRTIIAEMPLDIREDSKCNGNSEETEKEMNKGEEHEVLLDTLFQKIAILEQKLEVESKKLEEVTTEKLNLEQAVLNSAKHINEVEEGERQNIAELHARLENMQKELDDKERECEQLATYNEEREEDNVLRNERTKSLEAEKSAMEIACNKLINEMQVIDKGWVAYCNVFKSSLLDVDVTRAHLIRVIDPLQENLDASSPEFENAVGELGALLFSYNEISHNTKTIETQLVTQISKMRQQVRDGVACEHLEDSIRVPLVQSTLAPILKRHLESVERVSPSPKVIPPPKAASLPPQSGSVPPNVAPLPSKMELLPPPPGFSAVGDFGSPPNLYQMAAPIGHGYQNMSQSNGLRQQVPHFVPAQMTATAPAFVPQMAPIQPASSNFVPVYNPVPNFVTPAMNYVSNGNVSVSVEGQYGQPPPPTFTTASSGPVFPSNPAPVYMPCPPQPPTPVAAENKPKLLPPSINKQEIVCPSSRLENALANLSVSNGSLPMPSNARQFSPNTGPGSPQSSRASETSSMKSTGPTVQKFFALFAKFCDENGLPEPTEEEKSEVKAEVRKARVAKYGKMRRDGVDQGKDLADMAFEAVLIWKQMLTQRQKMAAPAAVNPSSGMASPGHPPSGSVMQLVGSDEHPTLFLNESVCVLCECELIGKKTTTDKLYRCINCSNNMDQTMLHQTVI